MDCIELEMTERLSLSISLSFPSGSNRKESACNAGDLGSVPGLRRSPAEGNGYPFSQILVWEISWTLEQPDQLQSMRSQKGQT